MKKISRAGQELVELDQIIEEITVDAHDDDEKLGLFLQAFEDNVALPCDAFVIGEPISVVKFDYGGNVRRGLTASCRREDGSEHVVAALDVEFPGRSSGARFIAAYHRWMGLEPLPPASPAPPHRAHQHKVAATDLDMSGPVELVALSIKENAARCRLLGSDRVITLRSSQLWEVVPGQIVVVRPRKQWRYAGHPYLSGEIESARLDVAALGLVPLKLEDQGSWSPNEHYWGEPDEPIEE